MTLSVQVSPSAPEAARILEDALRARKFVFVAGDCKVDYEGRASSVLEWGERVAIVKQDGSVLVHRPVGYEPVNWQPSGCLVKVWLEDSGNLVMSATRSQPRENVSIESKASARPRHGLERLGRRARRRHRGRADRRQARDR